MPFIPRLYWFQRRINPRLVIVLLSIAIASCANNPPNPPAPLDVVKMDSSHYYSNQVRFSRGKNPYYQYKRAERAYSLKDFTKSTKILRKAIRLRKDDHRFYQLLALSQLHTGKVALAKRNLQKAAYYATAEIDREKYNYKYELLTRKE